MLVLNLQIIIFETSPPLRISVDIKSGFAQASYKRTEMVELRTL